MNKLLTILLITLLCSCYSYAQLPGIPVPVPNAMDTYGININFPSSPGPSAPFTPSKQQNNIYDPNELIRRRQRAQQEIEEATAMMREIEECYSIASSLTKNGFPSQANIPAQNISVLLIKKLATCCMTPLL